MQLAAAWSKLPWKVRAVEAPRHFSITLHLCIWSYVQRRDLPRSTQTVKLNAKSEQSTSCPCTSAFSSMALRHAHSLSGWWLHRLHLPSLCT